MNASGRSRIVDLALVALALVLGAAVFFTRGHVTTGESESRENNVLVAFRDEDIREITIERGADKAVLVRSAADDAGTTTWSLREPVKDEVDPFAIDKLLGTLEFATVIRRIRPEEIDRKSFGLEAPRAVFSIDMGSLSYRLVLGGDAVSPAGAAYLEVSGSSAAGKGVVLVTKTLVDELAVTVDDFRGREIVPYLSIALDRMILDGAGGLRKLRRTTDKDWRFDGMMADRRIGHEALDRVLVQLSRVKAEKFLDAKDAEPAVATGEVVRIDMLPSKAGSPAAKITVGGKCPTDEHQVVALRREPDPVAACVPATVMGAIALSAESLVDDHVIALRKDEVESFSITRGDRVLELDRAGTGFKMRKPREADVDGEAGNLRLDDLVAAAGAFRQDAPKGAGLDPPDGVLVLKSVAEHESKVREERVELGVRQPDGTLPIRRKDDGAVLVLSAAVARAFEPDASLVRGRTIFDVGDSEVRTIETTWGGETQKLRRLSQGGLELDLPKGFFPDAGLGAELIDAVRSLRADRWVADRDDGSFGFADVRATVRFAWGKGDAGGSDKVLRIGGAAPGGSYAKIDDDPGVFQISRATVETLETWVLDRTPFLLVAGEVHRVVLTAGQAHLELDKRGDRFVPASGSNGASDARVAALIETLSALRPEAALHLGKAQAHEGLDRPVLEVRIEREPGLGDHSKPISFLVGAGDSWRGMSIHYARVEGVDATYALARSQVQTILGSL